MSFRRFQVLHYGVFPSFGVALLVWWYHGLARGVPADYERPG
jgi:hypothetical protein